MLVSSLDFVKINVFSGVNWQKLSVRIIAMILSIEIRFMRQAISRKILVPIDIKRVTLSPQKNVQIKLCRFFIILIPQTEIIKFLPTKHIFSQQDNKFIRRSDPHLEDKLFLPLGQRTASTLEHPIFVHTSIRAIKHNALFGIMFVKICD